MSVIEEPDVGNLQVRFCEGHGLSRKGINMMNERKGESYMSIRQDYYLIISLLNKKEKKKLLIVLGFMVIGGFFEIIGVGSISPFFSILSDPGILTTNKYLHYFYIKFNFTNVNDFLFWSGVVVVLFLFLNNIIRALISYISHRYAAMRLHYIAMRLLRKYLSQPYIYFLNKNTSELSKNILGEVMTYVHRVLSIFLKLVTNSIIAISLFILLLLVNPKICIISSIVLCISYIIIYRIVKNYLSIKGKERAKANEIKYKVVSEVFGGIKDVKILNKTDVFIDEFSGPSKEYALNDAISDVVSEFPKYIMETVAFGGIITLVLVLIRLGNNFKEILPLVSLYAFAGYRLMPALQKIFASLTKIKYNLPIVELLKQDFQSLLVPDVVSKENQKDKISFENTLELDNIIFTYPGVEKPIIQFKSLKIKSNTTVAFVGSTGCGKTTLVDIIMGLLIPNTGRIRVDGKYISEANILGWQENIGYVPQNIFLLDSSIKKNIAFGIPDQLIDMDRVKYVSRIANINTFIDKELEFGYEQIVGERGVRLSGGQRQRIGIARALYKNPSVLILDEATSALDNITELAIMDAINSLRYEKTIIVIAHRLSTIQQCDQIYFLVNGVISDQGTYDELLQRNKQFQVMARSKN